MNDVKLNIDVMSPVSCGYLLQFLLDKKRTMSRASLKMDLQSKIGEEIRKVEN